MANELEGRRVAFMAANEGMEQVEFTEPWRAVKNAGGSPELLAPEPGKAQAFNHLDKADTFAVDRAIRDADPGDFDDWCCRAEWPTPTSCGRCPGRGVRRGQCSRRGGRPPLSAMGRGPWWRRTWCAAGR